MEHKFANKRDIEELIRLYKLSSTGELCGRSFGDKRRKRLFNSKLVYKVNWHYLLTDYGKTIVQKETNHVTIN